MFFRPLAFSMFAYNSKTKQAREKHMIPLIVSLKNKSRVVYQISAISNSSKVVVPKYPVQVKVALFFILIIYNGSKKELHYS